MQILLILGHKRIESLNNYNSIPSKNQQDNISLALQVGRNENEPQKSKQTPGMPVKRSGLGLLPVPAPKKPTLMSESNNDVVGLGSITITPSTSSQAKKFKFKLPPLRESVEAVEEFDIDDVMLASQDSTQTQEPQNAIVADAQSVIQTQEPQKTALAVTENKENFSSNHQNDNPLTLLLFSLNNEAKLSDKRNELYNKILQKLN